jgi:hypothetical protein
VIVERTGAYVSGWMRHDWLRWDSARPKLASWIGLSIREGVRHEWGEACWTARLLGDGEVARREIQHRVLSSGQGW